MLVAVLTLTLTKIIEIPTLSPRKFAPLAYFDKYICRRLVASQAVLLARVLLVSMAVGGGGVGLHRDFFCAHSAATIPIPCKPTARFYFHPTLYTARRALRLNRNPQFRNPTWQKFQFIHPVMLWTFFLFKKTFSKINQNTTTSKLYKMTTLDTIPLIVIWGLTNQLAN